MAVASSPRRPRVLAICQVYRPDPASVGQHFSDACVALARRGCDVTVFTANRGYDDPDLRFPSNEMRDGVRVVRLPWSSFGKGSIAMRLVGGMVLTAPATLRGLVGPRPDTVLVSTVPLTGPLAALALRL